MFYICEADHGGRVNVWAARDRDTIKAALRSLYALDAADTGAADIIDTHASTLAYFRMFETAAASAAAIKSGDLPREVESRLALILERQTHVMQRGFTMPPQGGPNV